MMRSLYAALILCLGSLAPSLSGAATMAEVFERFKDTATKEDLYRFLYNMPKGGDLHNHLSGSGFADWWYEEALAQEENGYVYYTKTAINGCRPHDDYDDFGASPYLLLFRTIQSHNYQQLDACEQGEYKRLADLTRAERQSWMHSIELDKPSEGRAEFFGKHWQRINDLSSNPHLMAELLFRNMAAFGREGLHYLETMLGVFDYLKPDGQVYAPEEVLDIYTARIAKRDAQKTGVTVRFQEAILRFLPNAEEQLRAQFDFVVNHPDYYVSVNMVGQEDQSYPLRFLSTLRELRRKHNIPLSIHGGEVDGPNDNVRDTLLLGALRIGHGLNLITDADTMRLMRHGPYLIEINLISNLLLRYVSDYSQHPFPEYLRIGIPVALSTDDRGMWRSNLTDEFYVAVQEFNLTWDEILQLSRNSLTHGFMEPAAKKMLLERFNNNITQFERLFLRGGVAKAATKKPISHAFICERYDLCAFRY